MQEPPGKPGDNAVKRYKKVQADKVNKILTQHGESRLPELGGQGKVQVDNGTRKVTQARKLIGLSRPKINLPKDTTPIPTKPKTTPGPEKRVPDIQKLAIARRAGKI